MLPEWGQGRLTKRIVSSPCAEVTPLQPASHLVLPVRFSGRMAGLTVVLTVKSPKFPEKQVISDRCLAPPLDLPLHPLSRHTGDVTYSLLLAASKGGHDHTHSVS